jgi:hypothetical protein
MTMTATDVGTIEPLTHQQVMRFQVRELERTLTLLRSLTEGSSNAAPWTSARCTSTC